MKCNFCREETKPNDQNIVKLNCAKYMLCENCYQPICSLFDVYSGSGKKIKLDTNTDKDHLKYGGKFLGMWIGA